MGRTISTRRVLGAKPRNLKLNSATDEQKGVAQTSILTQI